MNALSITQAEYNDLFGDSDSEDENFMGFESLDSDDDSENGDPDTTDDENQNQPRLTLHEIETGAFADSWLKDFDSSACGPAHIPDDGTEYEYFSLFFDDAVCNLLVDETNRYASQHFERVGDTLKPHSRLRKWVDCCLTDIRTFLAILLLMGHMRLPNYEAYWTTNSISEIPGLKNIMSRNTFSNFMTFIHLANNDDNLPRDHPRHDRTFKVWRFLFYQINI